MTGIKECLETWQGTLNHFGITRAISQWEETQIGRAIQKYGFEMVELALFGARFEKKTEKFDPRDYVSLARVLEKDKEGRPRVDMYANAGARMRKKAPPAQAAPAQEEEQYVTDPKRVREIVAKAFGGSGRAKESSETDAEIERRREKLREQARGLK